MKFFGFDFCIFSFAMTLIAQVAGVTGEVAASSDISILSMVEKLGVVGFLVGGIIYLIREKKELMQRNDQHELNLVSLKDVIKESIEVHKKMAESVEQAVKRQDANIEKILKNQENVYKELLDIIKERHDTER